MYWQYVVGWWIFFSPREAFWSLLEQINPLYHFPAEIIGNILNGSGLRGIGSLLWQYFLPLP